MVSSNHKSHTENMESKQQRHQQQQQQRHHQSVSCDILLNTFQIKKKRYKVLLNYDHLVWERSDAKHCQTINNSGINEKTLTPTVAAQGINVAAAQKGELPCSKPLHS